MKGHSLSHGLHRINLPITGAKGHKRLCDKLHYDHKNIKNARKLRKEMTPWERKLWYCFLKDYEVKFQRQKPIGPYIADFYCAKAKLIIELDGGGHYDPDSIKKDNYRTEKLEGSGIKVIRFCNLDIDRNFYGVKTVIDMEVRSRITG